MRCENGCGSQLANTDNSSTERRDSLTTHKVSLFVWLSHDQTVSISSRSSVNTDQPALLMSDE